MEAVKAIIIFIKTRGLEYFGRYYSRYRGFVYDRNDPEHRGRLRLVIPTTTRKEPMEYWAPGIHYAGKGYGSQVIPKTGDVVWVTFEHGDPRFPIWEHGYFGKGEDDDRLHGYDNHWFKTPAGHIVELDDTLGEEAIRITHKTGHIINMTNEGISVETSKDVDILAGNNLISMDNAGINIETGGLPVFIGGDKEVLYSLVPGLTAIVDVAQIGVSTKIKVGP